MKKYALVFFTVLFASYSAQAFTAAYCSGTAEDEKFGLEIHHLSDYDGRYQKFVAVLDTNKEKLFYSGIIVPYPNDSGYSYLPRQFPELSTKHVNISDFSVFQSGQEPPDSPNLHHTEIRYRGKYSGREKCTIPAEGSVDACWPVFLKPKGSARMSCYLK